MREKENKLHRKGQEMMLTTAKTLLYVKMQWVGRVMSAPVHPLYAYGLDGLFHVFYLPTIIPTGSEGRAI